MSACHILLHSFVFEVAQEREGGQADFLGGEEWLGEG